jgi:hypothetical protein
MDIEQCGLNAAMAGESSDLVDVPTCARKVRQTEMAQRVRTESLDLGTSRELEDHLRPAPDGDRLGVIPTRL